MPDSGDIAKRVGRRLARSTRESLRLIQKTPFQLKKLFGQKVLQNDHVGRRATGKRSFSGDHPSFKKTMTANDAGRASFETEVLAHRLFADYAWMPPILEQGDLWMSLPLFPEESRLDHLAPSLSADTKLEIARQSMGILFDIFLAGYAHCDFHAKNLFWVDGQLYAIDFEGMTKYPDGERPAFPESYDVTGTGLVSPHSTGQMCYRRQNARTSLEPLLGVPADVAIESVREALADELHDASLSFQKKGRRHICKAERTYSSFSLPHFTVPEDIAQRNCRQRLVTFGVTDELMRGKSLLDLGSNIGGMVFATQRLGPAITIGVEYDQEKVAVASKVAAFNGLNNVRFVQRDIDQLTVAELSGPFDIVYCLAISEHVADRPRLFRLLAEATRERLFFEGNKDTDPKEVEQSLLSVGFREVRYLGLSDDDCRPENNDRPLIAAIR